MPTTIDEQQPPLRRDDLTDDPMTLFAHWFEDADRREVPDREAFCLSTATADGAVSGRMVLLRGLDPDGFTFFTNYESSKGDEIRDNPQVSLTFFWPTIYRQVRVQGHAERVDAKVTDAYFQSRPRDSQLGAWASHQSCVIKERHELWERYEHVKAKYEGGPVPTPDFWGGYKVMPSAMEFWQGQPSRMHDRFRFSRGADGWVIERLCP